MTDVVVELRPYESQQDLLERFRQEVEKSDFLRESRRKRWFVTAVRALKFLEEEVDLFAMNL